MFATRITVMGCEELGEGSLLSYLMGYLPFVPPDKMEILANAKDGKKAIITILYECGAPEWVMREGEAPILKIEAYAEGGGGMHKLENIEYCFKQCGWQCREEE